MRTWREIRRWRRIAACRPVDSAPTATPSRTACAADTRFSTAKPEGWLDLGSMRLRGSPDRLVYPVLETARSATARDAQNRSRAYVLTTTSAGGRPTHRRDRMERWAVPGWWRGSECRVPLSRSRTVAARRRNPLRTLGAREKRCASAMASDVV